MSDLTGEAEGSPAAKIALRSQLITARRQLTPAARLAAADQLQGQLLALVRRLQPPIIAAYAPVGPEPGGPGLPTLLAAEARLLLPVLLPDGDLDWAVFATTPGDSDTSSDAVPESDSVRALQAGPRGLLEPTGPRLGVDAIRAAALVLVPALAVDRRGMRMGRGGGSYDRALARLAGISPRPLVLALLHDGELVDTVPAEPHDQPVDGAITPRGGLTLNRAAEWTK